MGRGFSRGSVPQIFVVRFRMAESPGKAFADYVTQIVRAEPDGAIPVGKLHALVLRKGGYAEIDTRRTLYDRLTGIPTIVVDEGSGLIRYVSKRHILIDYSNLSSKPPPGSEQPVPDIRSIVHRLECGPDSEELLSKIPTRFVAGSISPRGTIESAKSRDPVWVAFNDTMYTIQLTLRDMVASAATVREREKEFCVDELLHNVMQKILLDSIVNQRDRGEGPSVNTLVLATGDGNRNEGSFTNFPGIVERMLQYGWNVEMWAWRDATSGEYWRMRETYPGQIRIIAWEDHMLDFVGGASAAAGGAGGASAPSVVSASNLEKKILGFSRRLYRSARRRMTRKHNKTNKHRR